MMRQVRHDFRPAVGLIAFLVFLGLGDGLVLVAHRADPVFSWMLGHLAGNPVFWSYEALHTLLLQDFSAGAMVIWPQVRLALSAMLAFMTACMWPRIVGVARFFQLRSLS